jgi:hypothetical protein
MNNPATSPSSMNNNAHELEPPRRLQIEDSHIEGRPDGHPEGNAGGYSDEHVQEHTEGIVEGIAEDRTKDFAKHIEAYTESQAEGHAEVPHQQRVGWMFEEPGLAGRNKS